MRFRYNKVLFHTFYYYTKSIICYPKASCSLNQGFTIVKWILYWRIITDVFHKIKGNIELRPCLTTYISKTRQYKWKYNTLLYLWWTLQCFEICANTVSSVSYMFMYAISIETQTTVRGKWRRKCKIYAW